MQVGDAQSRMLYCGAVLWHAPLQLGVLSHCSPNWASTSPSPQ
jgi:hypothetical protein